MGDNVLDVDGVFKKFSRGELHSSLRDLIPSLTQRLVSREQPQRLEPREFWALQDVSFSVRRGEAFDIIGANGAGESTILKLLTGIMRPTKGSIHVGGRISALIEVSAGFHQDLTGRENIYLEMSVVIQIVDDHQYPVYETCTQRLGAGAITLDRDQELECTFELDLNLGEGTFRINASSLQRYVTNRAYDRWLCPAT